MHLQVLITKYPHISPPHPKNTASFANFHYSIVKNSLPTSVMATQISSGQVQQNQILSGDKSLDFFQAQQKFCKDQIGNRLKKELSIFILETLLRHKRCPGQIITKLHHPLPPQSKILDTSRVISLGYLSMYFIYANKKSFKPKIVKIILL